MLPIVRFTICMTIACSDDGGGTSLAALGVDDGASRGASKSANVTGEKAVRIGLGTGALVEIPAGAVTKSVKVTLQRPADSKALSLVNRLPKSPDRIASAPYVLTPHRTKFQEDVTVTLPLAKKNAREVFVAWLEDEDDKQWKVLGLAEINDDKATIKLKHFSVLLLIEDASDLVPVETDTEDASADEDAGDPADAGNNDDATVTLPDAGGDELDAETMRDGGSGEPPDADARGDADALAPDAEAGTDAANPLLRRLTECGLVTMQGSLPEPVISYPYERCVYRCALAGLCSDVEGLYCRGGDTLYSAATQACIDGCAPEFFVCPDQTQGFLHCDGFLDCANGEDEADCDPSYFQCTAGERVPGHMRCDSQLDCRAGEDEQGCPWHMCDQGFNLRPDFVCDGFADCVDGSDEPPSCATVTCEVLIDQ